MTPIRDPVSGALLETDVESLGRYRYMKALRSKVETLEEDVKALKASVARINIVLETLLNLEAHG